jgi:quinol monooxygenase YgiN
MVIFTIKMNARPEKCLELKQSLLALAEAMRKEKGCLSLDVLSNIENDNGFCLIQTWKSRKDLNQHLQSDTFTLLMGTRYLLIHQPEKTISEISACRS